MLEDGLNYKIDTKGKNYIFDLADCEHSIYIYTALDEYPSAIFQGIKENIQLTDSQREEIKRNKVQKNAMK